MKSNKVFKISKTIVFFGLLFLVLQGILSLQPEYPSLLKSFYGSDVVAYVGLGTTLIGWLLWEISVAKKWLSTLIVSIIFIIAAVCLINGIIGIIGTVIGFSGMILFYLNKKEMLSFKKMQKEGFN